jgi:hypothetical protein
VRCVWFASHLGVNFLAVITVMLSPFRIRNKRCFEESEIPSASNCYKGAIKAVFNVVQNDLLQS